MRNDAGGLQVIGAGFGRTGTTSLAEALEQLGFGPCYKQGYVRPWDSGRWRAALKGEPVDWRRLFRGYRSALDWPMAAFYEELLASFPATKVILTVRDPERWYDSTMETLYQRHRWVASPLFNLTRIAPRWRRSALVYDAVVWGRTFHNRFEVRTHAIAVFNEHTERVKARVPPERLLVYDVRQGWGPLCAFLGVAVPDTPFPRRNDAAAFKKQHYGNAAAFVGALSALVIVGLLLLSRRVRAS